MAGHAIALERRGEHGLMPTFVIRPEQLAGVLKEQATALPQAVRRGARAGAMRGQAHMPKQTPVDMGQLRNSWRVSEAGGTRLYNDAPHAGIVEQGARPHPVSREGIEALAAWAHRKLGLDEKAAMRVAHAIAAKIKAQGQAPTYFTRGQMPELTRLAANEMLREIRKTLERGPK